MQVRRSNFTAASVIKKTKNIADGRIRRLDAVLDGM